MVVPINWLNKKNRRDLNGVKDMGEVILYLGPTIRNIVIDNVEGYYKI